MNPDATQVMNPDATHVKSPRVERTWPWTSMTFLLVMMGLIPLLIWFFLYPDSYNNALGYFTNSPLIADSYTRSFGNVASDRDVDVTFLLTNRSAVPIKLLGYNTSCTCVNINAIPTIIPASRSLPLKVSISTNVKFGTISQDIHLYTDHPERPQIVLTVSGSISETTRR
jgi:hypothetical protein